MPVYVYQVILEGDDEDEGQIFEVVQSMKDDALTHHPITGQPVRKVLQPPNLGTKYTEGAGKAMLTPENLAKHGMIRYERDASGNYVKTNPAKGPDVIDPNKL